MAWLKAVHIAGLSLWLAALASLPALLIAHRHKQDGADFARVRAATRFGYLALASPAAFVTVLSGTALLLVADALHGWMVVKLVGVGGLVLIHMRLGHLLSPFTDLLRSHVRARMALVWGAMLLSATLALLMVLWKPAIAPVALPDPLREPAAILSPPPQAPLPVPASPGP